MMLFEQRPLLTLSDAGTGVILGTIPTVACGQMLMLGILHTQINYFPIQVHRKRTDWDAYDFNSDTLFRLEKGWKISSVPPEAHTPEMEQKRKLMRLRLSYLHPWEIYCKGALSRFKGYMSDAVQGFIRHELTAGKDSGYVQEYASINEIEIENALEELSSKVRSLGIIEARNWAQYEKIGRSMAWANTRAELDIYMARGFGVLYDNSLV